MTIPNPVPRDFPCCEQEGPDVCEHGPYITVTEPGNCPRCGARRQYNTSYDIVHARAGTVECPSAPIAEPNGLLAILRALAGGDDA